MALARTRYRTVTRLPEMPVRHDRTAEASYSGAAHGFGPPRRSRLLRDAVAGRV